MNTKNCTREEWSSYNKHWYDYLTYKNKKLDGTSSCGAADLDDDKMFDFINESS